MFNLGDNVVFSGDPKQEAFRVNYVYMDGSVDLSRVCGDWEYVPARLLEKAPVPVKPGQVWREKGTKRRALVTHPLVNGSFEVALEGRRSAYVFSPGHIRNNFDLEHDAEG